MTDLVQRLRQEQMVFGLSILSEARERIEQLERELKTEHCLSFRDQVARLERENAELRNATLEEAAVIVMESAYRSNGTSNYEHVAQKIRSLKT